MNLINNSQRKRMVVFGLDGLPFSLAKELADVHKFRGLSKLFRSYEPYAIRAEMPEVSPVNWTSFYTGMPPQEHGIFGFTKINPIDYSLSLSNFNQVKCRTIFDYLAEKKRITKCINLPNTYPAKPILGMLISGFPVLELRKAIYPPPLIPILISGGYTPESDTVRGSIDTEFLIKTVGEIIQNRKKWFVNFWQDLAWDTFIFILTETDRLFHFLFSALEDTKHQYHLAIFSLLRSWDELLFFMMNYYDNLPEPKALIVMADHGFCKLKSEVDLNAWLFKNSLLHYNREPIDEWDCNISGNTKAFALDSGRIYLHTKERFSRGEMTLSEANRLKEEICLRLEALTFEGQRVIKNIVLRESFFGSTYYQTAPDIICESFPGFELKGKFNRTDIFGFFNKTGMHSADDTFFLTSCSEKISSVHQAGQLIYNYFG